MTHLWRARRPGEKLKSFFLSGPALVTAGGDARVRRLEKGAVRARAPGTGGGGIAADRALATEDTVTATSTAPDTSKQPAPHAPVLNV